MLSKVISFLRFPLMVGIVLIHSPLNSFIGDGYVLTTKVSYLFWKILPSVCVPLFFFFSGFLFFYRKGEFTWGGYFTNLKKRGRTLLIPYILWNIIAIMTFFLAQNILPNLMSGKNKLIADYSIRDFLWSFWDYSKVDSDGMPYPICFQMWFIRDLIVACVCSPIIYWLLKRLHAFFLVLLSILWILHIQSDIPGLGITGILFFSMGAYFSVEDINFVTAFQKKCIIPSIIWAFCVLFEFMFQDSQYARYTHPLLILSGIVIVIAVSANYIEKGKWKSNDFLTNSSFFLFASHALPQTLLIRIILRLYFPTSDFLMLTLFFLITILFIPIDLFVYYILKRTFPRLTAILTGGR